MITYALNRLAFNYSVWTMRLHFGAFSRPFSNSLMQYSMEPNSSLKYQWQEGVENLEGYRSGGYHPTHIGDQYSDSRYEVVHKLGYGSYSTVCLAKDHLEARYVSLKILIAAISEKSSECKILRRLALGKQDHQGRAYVQSLLNEFDINGRDRMAITYVW